MRNFLALLILFICGSAFGADRIVALVSVTNAAGTTNGQTITINGSIRTWTNNVVVSSIQILTNSTPSGAKTNAYKQIGLNFGPSWVITDFGITNFQLISASGIPLTVTLSAGWGVVSYSTQAVVNAVGVRIPTTVEAAAQQTNINSGLLAAIRDPSNTNKLYESDFAVTNLMGLTNAQTVAGAKALTNVAGLFKGIVSNSPTITGTIGGPSAANSWGVSNGYWWSGHLVSPVLTNGVNYGNAFSSHNAAANGEQFGLGSTAVGSSSLAIGVAASVNATLATAVGASAQALGTSGTAVGTASLAQNANDSAFGTGATADGTNSTALGAFATVSNGHTNTTAIGYNAISTAANQILLGGSGINAVVQNSLSVGSGATIAAGITNLLVRGTNSFPAGADISFGRYALSTLANGINQDIVTGTNVFVEVSGPSGAFSIEGIAGGRDGKFVIIWNATGQNMTIAVEGGATGNDPTAANRILSGTGADRATTGNGSAMLIYNASSSRWILLSLDP